MIRILIAEDDLINRLFLSEFLSKYGQCDIVVDGMEAIEAYIMALNGKKPYGLVCLDIMMPKIDGVKVLKTIREFETKKGILPEKRSKVIITTALGETELVRTAFEYGCEAYVSKPVDTGNLAEVMNKLGIEKSCSNSCSLEC